MIKLTPELKAKIERSGAKIIPITLEDLQKATIFVPPHKKNK
jgi:hypothetical protein